MRTRRIHRAVGMAVLALLVAACGVLWELTELAASFDEAAVSEALFWAQTGFQMVAGYALGGI